MLENSLLFVAYSHIQSVIRNITGILKNAPLPLNHIYLAGAISGSVTSFALTPVELVKCQLQVEWTVSKKRQLRPLSLLYKIIQENGVRGMYRGHLGTFLRETAGGAAWFGVYESTTKWMIQQNKKDNPRSELTNLQVFCAGALSGMAYNSGCFY
jgi:ornithine carrier protein